MSKRLALADVRLLLAKITAATAASLTGATNASPSVLNIAAHGLLTGDMVAIYGVTGNTAINGVFSAVKVDADHFTLLTVPGAVAVNGNGSMTGGSVRRLTCGLTPGDIGDLTDALARVKQPAMADSKRPSATLESTIQTLIGA